MMLPTALQSGQWQTISQGLSGASIFRGTFAGRQCFLKVTPHGHRLPVNAEYARLQWLTGRVPVAEVIAYLEDASHQYLVTAAVLGVALLEYAATQEVCIRKLAAAIHQLHDLPTADCPFIWTVEKQIVFAQASFEANAVKVSQLHTEFRGRKLDELFQDMLAHRPDTADLVVVHGDPYNDNILVNPDTGEVAAFLDVGHVGAADRYTDLAMIYDDLVHVFGEAGWQQFLRDYGLVNLDEAKMRFYRLFNEFM